jgi:DNA-binding SARP family transcriptional activator
MEADIVMQPMQPLPQLRIAVLGPTLVRLGETPLTFTRRKAVALLAYLAVSGGVHSRNALATLLAGEATAEEARGQLRSALLDLRRQVGAFLLTSRDSIALAQDPAVWLDVAELEAAAQDESAPASPARLAHAVSLYRGEFLAGLTIGRPQAFEAWLRHERARAKALLCRALTRLVDHATSQDDLPAAIAWARRLLEEEPCHEATLRQLMRLLARAGQREAALAQYHACRPLLAEKLHREPQQETTALFAQLYADPIAPPTNLPAPQAGFVGRQAELALITARLADPACRLLTLLGLGGSGKTSLALHAAAAQARPAPLTDEHRFADGVYLIDLAAIAAPRRSSAAHATEAMHHLATAIGRVLGLEFRDADPVTPLAAWLRERAMLLVLDNLEHLRDGADLLPLLLARAQRLKLLVTTRERLGLPEEWVVQVGGLALPAQRRWSERRRAASTCNSCGRQGRAHRRTRRSGRPSCASAE